MSGLSTGQRTTGHARTLPHATGGARGECAAVVKDAVEQDDPGGRGPVARAHADGRGRCARGCAGASAPNPSRTSGPK